ncbi:23S rRNA (uracil(1939)-C(5))-methyltransferase RlmD [Wansuia hejianensis]|uniref:23S rRNA (Uracil(1939)-C(5))-methyltransferase RlmD n=1 Tax=Wansuia hejianensis TaxID=2763667 RepID=A0A926IGK4_9FIRM|nr:23S rRNA (uracil(1939)-C(5))-methyltransferase RlmD [Wansuia hejianensis]MBC8589677.1 23S rRNA (uracil(1939)-C(5))-methyltransferase RlmD [Wansuia hejianensis]
MFNIGDIVEGEIIDFTHEGSGVLKVDKFTIFVKGGLIGDKLKAKIDNIKKSYATATISEIVKPSEERVDLEFEIEESKGGIPLIEYKYSKQLEWKKNKIKKDLEKIAGFKDIEVKEVIGMDHPYRYRNHVQIPVGCEEGRVVTGFYEIGSNDIVDMTKSILQPEVADEILGTIRKWINQYKIKPYDKKTRKGILRHIGIRTNRNNESMVILVTNGNRLPYYKELIDMLKGKKVISIYQNINKSNSSITYGREYKKLYGVDWLLDYIGDFRFNISPNSFFQVNRTQAEVLYNKTIQYLDLNKKDIVYDLYCGIGTISLYIGNQAKKVYGIEIIKKAIEDARDNAKLNSIDNVEFEVGKVEDIFPRLMDKEIKGNKIVVDPPRKGCEKEVLEAIVKLNPEKVVYVSCNPTTMARDAKYLVDNGYKIEEVQPVDMFPHTAHCEVVCKLEKE